MMAKIAPNLRKIGVHANILNVYVNLLKNLKFEKLENCNVLGLGWTKFDQGPKWFAIHKKSTCRLISQMGDLNKVSNLNFEKVKKSAFFRPWFD